VIDDRRVAGFIPISEFVWLLQTDGLMRLVHRTNRDPILAVGAIELRSLANTAATGSGQIAHGSFLWVYAGGSLMLLPQNRAGPPLFAVAADEVRGWADQADHVCSLERVPA
jgi:hypothetical protein